MVKLFVDAWDCKKSNLEAYFRSNNQTEYDSYEKMVKLLFNEVINPYLEGHCEYYKYNVNKIHVIDDGEYQGSQIFIIPIDEYQPIVEDYVWTCHNYGSCSGCDLLMGISQYSTGLPTDEQVKEYMNLELNLLQNLSYFKTL